MKALIIDDDYESIDLLREKIKGSGEHHSSTIACSNSEISIALKEFPDIIFVKSGLNFIEDLFLVRMIRAMDEFKQTPIVMVTPWHHNDFYHEAREAGVNGFVNSGLEQTAISAKLNSYNYSAAIA